jgi:hypothetical protein
LKNSIDRSTRNNGLGHIIAATNISRLARCFPPQQAMLAGDPGCFGAFFNKLLERFCRRCVKKCTSCRRSFRERLHITISRQSRKQSRKPWKYALFVFLSSCLG